jgi:hypothetical protein
MNLQYFLKTSIYLPSISGKKMTTKQTPSLYRLLMPNQGGAAGLIEAGVSSLHFKANDARGLAWQWSDWQSAHADDLIKTVDKAYQRLFIHYFTNARLNDFRGVFEEVIPS